MNAKPLIAAAAFVLLLAACGNKGPLVMPQKPVPVEEPVPAPPPAPTAAPATDPAAPVEPAPIEPTPAEPATPADRARG